MTGLVHIAAAVTAILLGLTVFLTRKGTRRHRAMGRSYVAIMAMANAAALTIYEDSPDGFGVFHYLALVSLASITVAYFAIRARPRRPGTIAIHGIVMSWSFAGLCAAAIGQGANALGLSPAAAILAALVPGGVLVHLLVPKSPLISRRPAESR